MRISSVSLAAVVILMSPGAVAAQRITPAPPKSITIVFDASVSEFRCWYSGPPHSGARCEGRPSSGAPAAKPFYDGIHFYRGDVIYLQIAHSTVLDKYTFELTVGDLVLPEVPVYGGFTELPSLKLIEPGERVITPGLKLAGKIEPLDITQRLFAGLDEFTPDELSAFVKTAIVDPAASDEVRLFAAWSSTTLEAGLNRLLKRDKAFVTQTGALKDRLAELNKAREALTNNFCTKQSDSATPEDVLELVRLADQLMMIVDAERALRASIEGSDLKTLATQLADKAAAAESVELLAARAIDGKALNDLVRPLFSGLLATKNA